MDFANFPHPDKHYPHPMESWPADVEAPVSVTLGEVEATVNDDDRYLVFPDPQNERTISQPACTITMANAATLSVVEVGDPEGGNIDEVWTGDWYVYLDGDTYTRDQVIDVATETIAQARK